MSFQQLGIGTRNPTKTLDVSGSVSVSESIDISGKTTLLTGASRVRDSTNDT